MPSGEPMKTVSKNTKYGNVFCVRIDHHFSPLQSVPLSAQKKSPKNSCCVNVFNEIIIINLSTRCWVSPTGTSQCHPPKCLEDVKFPVREELEASSFAQRNTQGNTPRAWLDLKRWVQGLEDLPHTIHGTGIYTYMDG